MNFCLKEERHELFSAIVAEKLEKAGNKMKLILKEGVGNYQHSLEDPAPIVDFILDVTLNKE